MTRKIIVCAKYFGYNLGGAERSIYQMLCEEERQGAHIKVILFENVRTFGAQRARMTMPPTWEIQHERILIDMIRFPYVTYWINRGRFAKLAYQQDPDGEMWSYGILAPAALNAFRGAPCYHMRDMIALGRDDNYHVGLKRFYRMVYAAVQWPFYRAWMHGLRACLTNSRLIANSEFIASEAHKLVGVTAEVCRPDINAADLKRRYAELGPLPAEQRGVLHVGDTVGKGTAIVRNVAALMPSVRFFIVGRHVTSERREGNITYLPWQSDPVEAYRRADLVIVPSLYLEGFCRVAAEARALGIPVLASRRGGIPEAVDYDDEALIDDVEDIEQWYYRADRILANCCPTWPADKD